MPYDQFRQMLPPALASLLLGLLLALQMKTQVRAQEATKRARVTDEMIAQFIAVTRERDRMRSELERMKAAATVQAQLQEEILLELAAAGLTEVHGPGVTVTMANLSGTPIATTRVRVDDVMLVVNELKAGGAEAIAINGVRVTPGMVLSRSGDGQNGPIAVNREPVMGPLVMTAVGDPAVLMSSINMRGGVVQRLMPWIHITVAENENLVIPAAPAPPAYDYARPVR